MPKKKAGQRGKAGKAANGTKNATKNQPAPRKASGSSDTENASTEGKTPAQPSVPKRVQPERNCKKRNNKNSHLEDHFRRLGLQIRKIVGDGNCMFRAFGDQMEGNENNHKHYRERIIKHISDYKTDYSIYHELEEERDFDVRLKKLAKNGTFGGQESLVAFARIFNRLIFIHQPDDNVVLQLPPSYDVDVRNLKQVHLLYTSGNHYDSIRILDDTSYSGANVLLVSCPDGAVKCSRDTRILSEPVPQTQILDAVQTPENYDFTPEDDDSLETVDTLIPAERDSGIGSPEQGSRESSESGTVADTDTPALSDNKAESLQSDCQDDPGVVIEDSEEIQPDQESVEPEEPSIPDDAGSTEQSSPPRENTRWKQKTAKKPFMGSPASVKVLSKKQKRQQKKNPVAPMRDTPQRIPSPVSTVSVKMANMTLVSV